MTTVFAERIGIDLRRDEIVVECDGAPTAGEGSWSATIDIGPRGALLGIDIGDVWIQIADPQTSVAANVRSASVQVRITGTSVIVPRRGPAYTIAWPSGNQCWRHHDGDRLVETCAVTIDR